MDINSRISAMLGEISCVTTLFMKGLEAEHNVLGESFAPFDVDGWNGSDSVLHESWEACVCHF